MGLRRFLRLSYAVGLAGLLVACDLLASWQHSTLASGPYLPPDAEADAAIVLGYALRRDGTPTRFLRQRVAAGVAAFDSEQVGYLLFSGGHPGGGMRGRSEAAAMEAYAATLAQRSSDGRWLLEEASTSTRENALFSLEIAKERRWRSVVVATNPFHQLRSRLTFQCAAKQLLPPQTPLQVWLAPVPLERATAATLLWEPLLKQALFWRELLALAWYSINGWLC